MRYGEVAVPDTGKTVGLVVGVTLGTAAVAALVFFIAGAIALSSLRF